MQSINTCYRLVRFFRLLGTSSPHQIRHSHSIAHPAFEKFSRSIIYSSYVEDNKVHLPHRKKYILKKDADKRKRTTNDIIKPFSLAVRRAIAAEGTGNYDDGLLLNKIFSPVTTTNNITEPPCAPRNENTINEKRKLQNLKSWMSDYETFQHDGADYVDGVASPQSIIYGTSNPNIPVSKVPCHGCGAHLHCADSSLPGYLPSELFPINNDEYLKTITCQRCHFLKEYNTALDVIVKADEYERIISSIADKFALVILMVDLTNFPCSIWPNIQNLIGANRPIFVVGNKVDLLPRDSSGYLEHVKNCLTSEMHAAGIKREHMKHLCLISAHTGYGVEELITKLHNVWSYKGDVYLIGCTNVGKSTLFNALLRSDYCKVKARDLIMKATTSPWPGTTLRMLKFPILRPNDWRLFVRTKRILSERNKREAENQLRADQANATGAIKYATLMGHIGLTFNEKNAEEVADVTDPFGSGAGDSSKVLSINEKSKDYVTSKWCFDTPGVEHPDQVMHYLSTSELLLTVPKQMIVPRVFLVKPEMSLFLAGLGRIDYLTGGSGNSIRLTVFASDKLPILIVNTREASAIYDELLGTDYLAVPCGDDDRMKRWPGLKSSDRPLHIIGKGENEAACDILLSTSGWLGVNIGVNEDAYFNVWTPEAKGIFVRDPSLLPMAVQLKGKRIRGSLAYTNKKAFCMSPS